MDGDEADACRIRSLGNAGIEIRRGARRVYIDAYFAHHPGVGSAPLLNPDLDPTPDLLLVTHDHPDHCLPSSVLRAARRARQSGRPMTVAAPARTWTRLERTVPPDELPASSRIVLDPRERVAPPDRVDHDFGFVRVSAFRTRHGVGGHNSYLVDWDGARVFHDGDNERTQIFDTAAIGPVDVLCSCPWRGSGAGELLRRWRPGRWMLIHLTPEELAEQARGEFLPELVEGPLPEDLPVYGLSPGAELALTPGRTRDA